MGDGTSSSADQTDDERDQFLRNVALAIQARSAEVLAEGMTSRTAKEVKPVRSL